MLSKKAGMRSVLTFYPQNYWEKNYYKWVSRAVCRLLQVVYIVELTAAHYFEGKRGVKFPVCCIFKIVESS